MVKPLGDQLRSIYKKQAAKASLYVRKVVIELSRDVVFDTPVGEKYGGLTRGSYVVGFGQINFTQPNNRDVSGSATTQRLFNEINNHLNFKEDIFVTSTLAWIGVLEFGGYPGVGPRTILTGEGIFSKQAPGGMVRRNVDRANITARKVLASLK